MTIMDDGICLHAELDRPEGFNNGPLCIVIHGFTGHSEEQHILAVSKTMNSLGIATLRVDMYGHGKSGGSFREHTLYKWLTNAMTVIDYARGLDFVTKLYLCGHSQGGLTSILAAAMKRDVIDALIPLSPANMIPEASRRGELLGVTFDPSHVPETLSSWDGRLLSGNYVRVAQTIYVEKAIDNYPGPVLLVHGDADEAVPFEEAEKAVARYQNATLIRISGDDHCYNFHLDQVTDAIRTWILKNSLE